MAWYRANARFGPWEVGDEFESESPRHAELAEKTKLLTKLPTWGDDSDDKEPPAGDIPPRNEELEVTDELEGMEQDVGFGDAGEMLGDDDEES